MKPRTFLLVSLLALVCAAVVYAEGYPIPVPEQGSGWKRLPADGGEAQQFVNEVFTLMKSKKYGQVRKLVNRSDEDDRFAATVFCNHSRAKNMKLAGGYRSQSGKTFLLFLDFSDEEYIDALSHVVLTKEGKQWQLENCSGDWDPFW